MSANEKKNPLIAVDDLCMYFDSAGKRIKAAEHVSFEINEGEVFGLVGESGSGKSSIGKCIIGLNKPTSGSIRFFDGAGVTELTGIKSRREYIEKMRYIQMIFMCYVNGMLDVIKISGEVYELSKDDPCLRYFQSVSTYFYDMNFRDVPALQNRNIRMALAKSIDRESITKNIMGSGYFPLERVNPPGYYSEEDGSDFSGDRHRYDEYMHYDTARALELWRKGLEKVGITSLTIEFSYLSSFGKVAEAIKSQMESALPGLELKLKTMHVKEYNTKILTGSGYEMMVVGWGADFADPAAFLSLYYKCEGVKYTNEEFDRIFAESSTAEAINTPGRRNELLHKAEDILMEDVAQIPFYTLASAYLVRDTVKNFDLKPTGLDKEGT